MPRFYILLLSYISLFVDFGVCQAQTNSLIQHAQQIASADNSVLFVGPMSLYANPAAGLQQSRTWAFLFGVDRRYTSDLGSLSAAATKKLGGNSLGILVGRYGIDGFNEHLVGLSFSRSIGKDAYLGIQGNIHQLRIENLGQRSTFDFSVGYWQQYNERLILSAYLKNPIQLIKEDPLLYGKAELSVGYIFSEKLTFFGGLIFPWNYTVSLNPGFRYTPIKQISFLVSFSTAPSASSFGLSLAIATGLRMDIGWSAQPLIGNIFGLTIGYAIDG